MDLSFMKRVLSLLLALVLLIGNVPSVAFATEEIEEETVAETSAPTEAVTEPVMETSASTEAATEEPAKETVAPTVPATEPVQETVVPTEPVQETVAPTEAATEPAVEETIAPTLPAVPEETVAPAEPAEGEAISVPVKTEYRFSVSDLDLPTDEELYTAYAEHVLYGTQIATFGTAAGERLTGDEKLLYDAMVPLIKQIASGERASTVIGVGQTVTSGGVTYEPDVEVTFTGAPLEEEAMTRVFDALLSDLPYEMYWFDKTAAGEGFAFTMDDVFVYGQQSLPVAGNYQGADAYTVDTAKTGAAAAAVESAEDIVAKYAASSDYEKLVGYRDEICALVSYNFDALNIDFNEDNDPWQLIYVFDGDESSNVVCEGYSKAFMYLCDKTNFAGDVSCYTVSGQMNGGNHMWNVVTIEGSNYLVDVTNSDAGMTGQNGGLFLAGGTGSAGSTYNVMNIYYAYNIRTKNFWGTGADSILTLASENYTPQTDGSEEEDENLIARGTCGENLTWTLDAEGTLTISGTGAMDPFASYSQPWETLESNIRKVVLEDGVTSIGDYAFHDCSNLTDVTVGKDVTSIAVCAFSHCSGLTSINIPGNVASIGFSAFENCSSLASVTIGDGVTEIGFYAFNGCSSLTSVSIPDSVNSIGNYAFKECTGLTSVTIGGGVTSIGENAFNGCTGLTGISIPDSVTSIGGYAFMGCQQLKSVKLPAGLTAIDGFTFYNCSSLESIDIPDGVKTIGNKAFYNCTGLTDIDIPDGVTGIGEHAFSGCTGVTRVDIPDGVTAIETFAFGNCENLESVVLPSELISIGANAFFGCRKLTEIEIPDSVTTIGDSAFGVCQNLTNIDIPASVTSIGRNAFSACQKLEGIWVDAANTTYCSDASGVLYTKDMKTLVVAHPAIEYNYEVAGSVTTIEDYAFANSFLRSIVIPASVTSIGSNVFANGSAMECITFEGDAPEMKSDAFRWVTTTAYYPANNETWTESVRQNYGGTLNWVPIFRGTCGENLTWELDPKGVLTISGTGAMTDYWETEETAAPWYAHRESITSVVIEAGATSIGDNAFRDCRNITSIDIPDGVTKIGLWAFVVCRSLERIEIPASVTSIREGAFAACANLEEIRVSDGNSVYCNDASGALYTKDMKTLVHVPNITGDYEIPDGVSKIDVHAFSECSNLSAIQIPDSVTHIGFAAFIGCSSLENINIPDSVLSLGHNAFNHCTNLKNVKIGSGVTNIESYLFYNCTSLEKITIPATVNAIGQGAFEGCTNLREIWFDGDAPEFYAYEGENNAFQDIRAIAYYFEYNPTWTAEIMQDYGGDIAWVSYVPRDTIASGLCGERVAWTLYLDGTLTIGGEGPMYNYEHGDQPWAAYKKSIKSVEIKSGVTFAGWNAFRECTNLATVTLGSGMKSIGGYAFAGCKALTEIRIPEGVTSIAMGAFTDCSGLKTAVLPSTVTDIGMGTFQLCTNLEHVNIPAGVEVISNGTFMQCSSLKKIELPDSVKTIEARAFSNCVALTGVKIPAGVTAIGEEAFAGCSTLTGITFEGDAPAIESDAFGDVKATVYYSAGNPTWTSDVMLGYGSGITWKTIPHGTCGENVTWKLDAEGVLTISGTGDMDGYGNDVVSPWWNDYREEIKSVIIGDGVTSVGHCAFFQCENLTDVTIGKDVTNIGRAAFAQCWNLENITLPEGLTSIELNAFYGCAFTSIELPDSLTTIGHGAFGGNWKLTNVEIPAGVTSIDKYAFYQCDSLKGIWVSADNETYCNDASGALYTKDMKTLVGVPGGMTGTYKVPGGVTRILEGAFAGCRKLTSVEIPSSITEIEDGTFSWCSGIKSIVIPNSVTRIGSEAFFQCAMESIRIPASVKSMGNWVFSDCSNLKTVTFEGDAPTMQSETFTQRTVTAYYPAGNPTWTSDVMQNYGGTITWLPYGETVASGTCGENLTWSLNNKGTLTISGTGAMTDYTVGLADTPWWEFTSEIKSVVIQDGVTSIGDDAFLGCLSLTSVTMGKDVTSIGTDAFGLCRQLQSVYIPAAVTSIDAHPFAFCNSLDGIWVDAANSAFCSDASGVLYTKDGKRLVQAPGKLSGNYVIPDTVTEMDDYAFSGCTKLTGIRIPDGITALEGTFSQCSSLTNVTIPNSVTRIGVEAFSGAGLTSINIPASVTSIEWYAFSDCGKLKKITFEGDAPQMIFLDIPQPDTFRGVTATAYYPSGNPTWTSDVMQNYGGKITWKPIPYGTCGENVTWMLDDEGVLTISGTGAMEDYVSWDDKVTPWNEYRESIKSVVIKDGVTSVGDTAFYQCSNLTTATIGKDVTSIGNGAFAQCFKLENFTLPEGLVSIGFNAFVYCNATSIVLPESLTTIGEGAFSGCPRLTRVEIPAGLTSIGEGAFAECVNLEGIWVSKENPVYCSDASGVLYSKDMTRLIQVPAKLSGEYRIPAGVTYIADEAFGWCEKLTRVVIPNGVTSIGWAAFWRCKALESVIIPDSVDTIEYAAFSECSNLTSVKIPAGVTDIGDAAFSQCSSLKGIWVSNSNTAYCSDVYGVLYTKDMTELVQAPGAISGSYAIPGSVTVIHHCAFSGCEKLSSVVIPDSVETIDWSAFAYCRSLTSIVIPDGVTSLGDTTFADCERLKSIAIPASVTSISQSAFERCKNLEDVYYGGTANQWASLDESVPDAKYMHYSCEDLSRHWRTFTVDPTYTAGGYSYEYCSCGYERNNVITGNALGLPKPVVQAISDSVTGGATLRWEHDGEADRYEVYRATSKSGKYTRLVSVPSSTVMVSVSPGKIYYYKVKAICDANSKLSSGYSSVVKVTGRCAQPQISVEVNPSSGKPVIKWSKISGAKKYYVYRVDDVTGALTSIGSTTKTYLTDSKAVIGTTYSYLVRANASKSAYNSVYSVVRSCRTLCAQPVVTLKINADTGKPTFSWKAVSGAAQYEILRAESADGTFVRLAVLSDLWFEDSTAAPDKDYWYKVNALGATAELNSADGTAKKIHATLAKPMVTFAVDEVSGKPVLTWEEVPGAVQYKIYRSTSAKKSYKAIATVTDTEYVATSASVGKGYYYKVIAIGETAKSAYSSYKKLTAKCAQPVITVAASETSGKPVIKWSKISGAKKYYVYRVDEVTGTRTSIGSTTKTYFTDSKAAVGTTYTYQVRANGSKSAYNSIFSAVESCLTILGKPVVTVKNDAVTGKVILSWKAIPGATAYEVYRTGDDGILCQMCTQSALTYTDEGEGTDVDTVYTYKVKAITGEPALDSADSNEVTRSAACARPVASIALNGKKPMVSWTPVEGATKYYVYRSTKKSSGYKKVVTVEDASYTDSKAKKGTTYYYKVVAVSENATSAQSAYVKIKSK